MHKVMIALFILIPYQVFAGEEIVEKVVFHTEQITCYLKEYVNGTSRPCDKETKAILEAKARKKSHQELGFKCSREVSRAYDKYAAEGKFARRHAFKLLDMQIGETIIHQKGFQFHVYSKGLCQIKVKY